MIILAFQMYWFSENNYFDTSEEIIFNFQNDNLWLTKLQIFDKQRSKYKYEFFSL